MKPQNCRLCMQGHTLGAYECEAHQEFGQLDLPTLRGLRADMVDAVRAGGDEETVSMLRLVETELQCRGARVRRIYNNREFAALATRDLNRGGAPPA